MTVIAVVTSGLAVTAGAASAAPARPDLTVSKLTTPAAVTAGGALRVATTVTNTGRKKAGSSVTRFVLSRDRRTGGDVTLTTSRSRG
ncbi:MAG: CARDB domain-containing protein [Aeromicrobium sp.]